MFLELTNKRYSCRSYSDRPIEKDVLEYIMKCAANSPSACNKQPVKAIIINNAEEYASYCGANKSWLGTAPNLILILKKGNEGWIDYNGNSTSIIDATIFADYITLAASSKGLATCWIKGFEEEKIKQCIEISGGFYIAFLLTLGYPENDSIPEKKRKSIEELFICLEIDRKDNNV